MVKPNDWVVVVKREPENDELVVASIDNEKMVIARYQQGSLELSDSTKIAKWKLIGVIERFPDYFISHPFRVDKYISAVNSFLLLVSLVDFGAIGLLPT